MADFLTHLCLPLTATYVLVPEVFRTRAHLALGAVGLLPDADKFLGYPGLLHSLLTLVPIGIAVFAVEYVRDRGCGLAPVVVALLFSHLLLDFVDGGPVPLLFPLVEWGVGLTYPVRTVFGVEPFGVALRGPLVEIRTATPRPGYNTYGFIKGLGVANALLFLTVYLGLQREGAA